MLDLLKKIGIPATVAAVIATVVTITPFLFKIDERYAKDSDLAVQRVRTEKALNDMAIEIGKLAGSQQALIAIIGSQESRRAQRNAVVDAQLSERQDVSAQSSNAQAIRPVRPIVPAGPMLPPPSVIFSPKPAASAVPKLEEVSRQLQLQQQRIEGFKY